MSLSPKLRFEILRRDGFTCQYCGAKGGDVELQVDHIHPKAAGGTDDPGNLITACFECNNGKRDTPLVAIPEGGYQPIELHEETEGTWICAGCGTHWFATDRQVPFAVTQIGAAYYPTCNLDCLRLWVVEYWKLAQVFDVARRAHKWDRPFERLSDFYQQVVGPGASA